MACQPTFSHAFFCLLLTFLPIFLGQAELESQSHAPFTSFGISQETNMEAVRPIVEERSTRGLSGSMGSEEEKALKQRYQLARALLREGEEEKARRVFEQIWQTDSSHPLAAEAYFHSWPLSSYGRGEEAAIEHLQKLSERFPATFFSLCSYYLLANHWRKKATAHPLRRGFKRSMQRACSYYRRLQIEAEARSSSLEARRQLAIHWLRCRALLEETQAMREIARHPTQLKKPYWLAKGAKKIEELFTLMEGQQWAQEDNSDGSVWSYDLLAAARLEELAIESDLGQLQQARQDAEALLGSSWISGSPACARYGVEAALLMSQLERRIGSVDCLLVWQQRGEQLLPATVAAESLQVWLWMEKAMMLEQLGSYDEAILALAKVINSDVASFCRIKAMMMRGEIYQKQGRWELASKQLKAVVARGGLWAPHAERVLKSLEQK